MRALFLLFVVLCPSLPISAKVCDFSQIPDVYHSWQFPNRDRREAVGMDSTHPHFYLTPTRIYEAFFPNDTAPIIIKDYNRNTLLYVYSHKVEMRTTPDAPPSWSLEYQTPMPSDRPSFTQEASSFFREIAGYASNIPVIHSKFMYFLPQQQLRFLAMHTLQDRFTHRLREQVRYSTQVIDLRSGKIVLDLPHHEQEWVHNDQVHQNTDKTYQVVFSDTGKYLAQPRIDLEEPNSLFFDVYDMESLELIGTHEITKGRDFQQTANLDDVKFRVKDSRLYIYLRLSVHGHAFLREVSLFDFEFRDQNLEDPKFSLERHLDLIRED